MNAHRRIPLIALVSTLSSNACSYGGYVFRDGGGSDATDIVLDAPREAATEMDVGDSLEAPRPIAPLSTSTVTSRRPTFRWALSGSTSNALVELCRDRACSRVVRVIQGRGNTGEPDTDLERGVWYWRLRPQNPRGYGTRTGPVWQFRVGTRNAPVNSANGTTLDVNGDGYADLAVGAPAGGLGGRVYVYYGSPSGLPRDPSLVLESPDMGAGFGASVASAGDLDGDGYGDLAVGAPGSGVHIYLGGPSGIGRTPSRSFSPASAEAYMSVAGAGDVDGDGYGDLIVGAPFARSEAGSAHVFFGTADAASIATWRVVDLSASLPMSRQYGASVAGACDVNGDHYADVLVSEPGGFRSSGAAYLYLGRSGGLNNTPVVLLPPAGSGMYGIFTTFVGDVNGDGYCDILGVAPNAEGPFLYFGQARAEDIASAPPHVLRLPGPPGSELAVGTGDLDGDGFADLVAHGGFENTVYVMFGRSDPMMINATSAQLTSGSTPVTSFGWSLGAIDDANGDLYPEVVVGSEESMDGGAGRRRVEIFEGRAGSVNGRPTLLITSPETGDGFGRVR